MKREQQMQDMMTAAFWLDIEEGNQPDHADAIEIAKTYERAYQQGWKDADSHPNWIPVEEELPKKDGKYLFYDEVLGHEVSIYYDGGYSCAIHHPLDAVARSTEKGGEQ